jgi:hypothetical protein
MSYSQVPQKAKVPKESKNKSTSKKRIDAKAEHSVWDPTAWVPFDTQRASANSNLNPQLLVDVLTKTLSAASAPPATALPHHRP